MELCPFQATESLPAYFLIQTSECPFLLFCWIPYHSLCPEDHQKHATSPDQGKDRLFP